jgi:NADPH-dependent glutamate synthase beta subunit-like oxidoreductase
LTSPEPNSSYAQLLNLLAIIIDKQLLGNSFQFLKHTRMDSKSPIIPVLIIGAGASGIAMGCKLQRKYGFGDYKIFEKQSEIGGMLLYTFLLWAISNKSF